MQMSLESHWWSGLDPQKDCWCVRRIDPPDDGTMLECDAAFLGWLAWMAGDTIRFLGEEWGARDISSER